MSITSTFREKLTGWKDYMSWWLNYNSLGNLIWMPYWLMMNRERGTEFPFYFPGEADRLSKGVESITERFDEFLNCHEMEKNRDGDFEKTLAERFRWVFKNFHIYSNDTMSNMYFTKKLPDRDYQRLKHTYNQLSIAFLGYNTLSGILLIALNNFAFRSRKVSLPLVALASASTMLTMTCNYHLSYYFFDKFLSISARRLGHGEMIHRYNTHYKRNLEFTAY